MKSSGNIEFIKVAMPQVGEEEVAAVREVLLSGYYASGAKVEEFERSFAEYVGVNHAVAVNSGTSALYIALEAMGIGEGDEVIVPPMTFFATVSAVLYLRAKPVFADIDQDDLCLSPGGVAKMITDKTKAILPVHLFGAAANMNALLDLAKEHGLVVLEDCAQAHGTEYKGRKVGSIGNAGAFSFFATKHMTTGEGGMITTDYPDIAEMARKLRSHGMTDRDTHTYLAYNNRMSEIGAAMGLIQLGRLDELNAIRIRNSEYIINRIHDLELVRIPLPRHSCVHTYFWCPVIIRPESGRTIEELKVHLKTNGIGFRHRYTEPLYWQPVFKRVGLDYSGVHLQVVEQIAGNVIGLPNHPGLSRDDLDRVVEAVRSF